MKKNLLAVMSLFLGLAAYGQTNVIFEDNFESYPDFDYEDVGNWTLVSEDGFHDNTGFADVTFPGQAEMTSWIVFNPFNTTPPIDDVTDYNWDFSPVDGEKYMLSKYSFSGQNKDWLISPQIQLPADGVISLEFIAKAPSGYFPNESFNVLVSTTDTSLESFTLISSEITDTAKQWIDYSFNLNEYAGENVYLAIEYTSNNVFALLIDNFRVTQEITAGTSDLSTGNLYIYPNPAASDFGIVYPEGKFEVQNLKISLTDLTGKTVKTFDAADRYDISDLPKGIYVIEATDGRQTISSRIIKK